MNSKRSFWMVRNLVMVAGALILCAGLASAKDAAGKFTLTSEARWGDVVLAPGLYSFRINSTSQGRILTLLNEENRHAVGIVMAQSDENQIFSEKSDLVLVHNGGKAFVRALELKDLGMTFYYSLPKGQNQILAQAPMLIQRVPIAMAGK